MKKFTLLFSILFLLSFTVMGQGWAWIETMGDIGSDELEHIAVDQNQNAVVAGKFSGLIWFGSDFLNSYGDKDVLIVKYTSAGNFAWARSGGGLGTDEGLSIATDNNNNVFVTGFYTGIAVFDTAVVAGLDGDEMFIVKYDSQGNFQWLRHAYGPGDERGKGIACDASGNVFVTGFYKDTCYFESTMLVSPGLDNVFLAKYDENGNLLWVLDGGSASETWASTVGVNSSGEAWITGSFEGTAAFGSQSITSNGGNDVFLVKASASGSWDNAVNAGGVDDDFGNGLFVDADDHIAVTGSFFSTVTFPPAASISTNGGKDGFVAYYNPAGFCNWVKNFGGSNADKGIDVTVDNTGFVYVTGFINGVATFNTITKTSAGGDDIFLTKYDPAGNILYAELAGGSNNDYGKGIGVAGAGNVFVGGLFQGTASFGSNSFTSAGDRDGYLAMYMDGSPEITSYPEDSLMCTGEPITLTVTATGAAPLSYQWYDQSGSIMGATGSSYTFTPTDPSWSGDYYCKVSNPYGFVNSEAAYIGVFPDPEPDLGPDQTILDSEVITLDAGTGFYSYSWSNGKTTQTIFLEGSNLGIGVFPYSVTVTNAADCEGSDDITITVILNGIEELEDLYGIKVFPNPVKDELQIFTGDFDAVEIIIHDLTGKEVYLNQNIITKEVSIPFNLLNSGVYFLSLRDKEGQHLCVKLIKE